MEQTGAFLWQLFNTVGLVFIIYLLEKIYKRVK